MKAKSEREISLSCKFDDSSFIRVFVYNAIPLDKLAISIHLREINVQLNFPESLSSS